MKWKYKNNTERTIFYRDEIYGPDEEFETLYPVPSYLGLTCLQEGNLLDPVLFHDDVLLGAGEEKIIELGGPRISQNVALRIICMTEGAGLECRFNNSSNNPVPIDIRGFSHVLSWELCSKIFLRNSTEIEGQISITVIEVVS